MSNFINDQHVFPDYNQFDDAHTHSDTITPSTDGIVAAAEPEKPNCSKCAAAERLGVVCTGKVNDALTKMGNSFKL